MEIEARSGAATIEDVALTCVTAGHSMSGGDARPAVVELRGDGVRTTFSMTPARPGASFPDGRPAGGRPQLILRSEAGRGASRVLSAVEGGGALSITATLDLAAEAALLYREQLEGAVAP